LKTSYIIIALVVAAAFYYHMKTVNALKADLEKAKAEGGK